ncbi:hypothetical protein DFQ01_11190 [Paenibacillus cellulosilyticus]|uniref:DUF4440 domain-containing protein n=1 Tax=Paenibacillus cellulosilyticus TaxID=375489 RepID=A0A2V2YS64_9BACL|nr:DUF4440 domain-containing protein [Paenibacillus cellulosilyticus]PWW00943.1 hypothetical protein DFQ01_11190 [Paenibacillus cellulosilyticus]QKS47591.1 nuclear transport factor 2 family protein [Paenibacillus cellulosilyticus]
MELPEDIDQKAAVIIKDHFSEQKVVLSNLSTYYTAYNAEDLDRLLQYTAPSFIEYWEDYVLGSETWEDHLKESFSYTDEKYKLSDERVIFLGNKEAVVQGTLSWSDATQDIAEGDYVYEALIYMEYANGHWTYSDYISLDQDFDNRGKIEVFK